MSVRERTQERRSEHKIEEATLERVGHELGRLRASRRNTYESRSTIHILPESE